MISYRTKPLFGSRSSIGAAALMLPPRTQPQFSVAASCHRPHAASFTPSHLRCRLRPAAFALQLSRGRSAGGSGPQALDSFISLILPNKPFMAWY